MLSRFRAYLARRRFNRLIAKPFDQRAETLRRKHAAGVKAVEREKRAFVHQALATPMREQPRNQHFGSAR